MKIDFNKPYLNGKEIQYIAQSLQSGHISGNGPFTKKCQHFFESNYQFKKCLLTTSCTDALEMAAILMEIQPGDEVIIPSYSFVSTANAFVLRGAKVVFADSCKHHPNIDPDHLETLITKKTRAIVVVHYAGVACEMDKIMALAEKHDLFVVEDAAQAVNSYYHDRALGGIGHFGAFSFHATKNIISGEGGMLMINQEKYIRRAEIIWEKGTNKTAFIRGEVDQYGWQDIGSSFLPADLISAFLYAQLESLEEVHERRKKQWAQYFEELSDLEKQGHIRLPFVPAYANDNAHIFYLVVKSESFRDDLIQFLKSHQVKAVFHYLSLHKSPYFSAFYKGKNLGNADRFTERLLRLPLYHELPGTEISMICSLIKTFFEK